MITNKNFIKNYITNNGPKSPVPYRWTHGATDLHMGDGMMVYALIQHLRAKNCLCIGSGGGYIPRIITQARLDLHSQKIFEGDNEMNWGDIGATYVVDACNGIGGPSDLDDPTSFYRTMFSPRFIKTTSEDAFYNFFIREEIKLDFIFIDGDHSYEGVKKDFELYSTILTDNGIIVLHDTDEKYEESLVITEDEKQDYHSFEGPARFIKELEKNNAWNLVNLFNFGILDTKPSSSGITLINKRND